MSEPLPPLVSSRPARIGPRANLKVLGILLLLVVISIITASANGSFLKADNVQSLIKRTSIYAILGIGVAFVIITSGIDLSLGSVVALIGCLLAFLIRMDFHAIDQAEVLELNAGSPTALVAGDFSRIRPGDMLHLSAEGADKAIVTVKSAKFDPKFPFYGTQRDVTTIELQKPLTATATVAKLTRAVRIIRSDPASKTLLIENPAYKPSVHDRITVTNQTGRGIYELDVLRVEQDNAGLKVTLSDAQNSLSADHAFAMFQRHSQMMSIGPAIACLLVLSALIGLGHGLLITRLKLQPFVVTLCGLLIYRGTIRFITVDSTQGFGITFDSLRYLVTGTPFQIPIPFLEWLASRNTGGNWLTWVRIPMPFLIMSAIAIVAAIFLNRTIYGRYLFALGRNEQAARYSGINTNRMILLAYVICSLLAGFGGMLFLLDDNTGQPSNYGEGYELYAIAAAVLGGCSLRGGEGSILGVVIGAAVMRVLYNAILLLGIRPQLEPAVIGAVILGGVITDELVKRFAARRRAAKQAA